MRLTLGQIADWIHAEGDFTTNREVIGYSIDSRTVGVDELFFAVTGDRVDGHDYVAKALEAGAAAAVVSQHWLAPDELDACRLLRVPEGEDCVLRALQTLARAVRKAWGGRVIGVTGSAGKTTTKDAIAVVLEAEFRVLKTEGNLNNHFGLPLQLLRLGPEHEVAVLEMGMNHAGEIAELARIAAPNWGVVSNVGPVHLEFFADGIAGIARAKRELIDALPADGLAVLNGDDPLVRDFGRESKARAVLYGVAADADVRVDSIEELGLEGVRFRVQARGESATMVLRLLGRHNVLNAAAAVAVGQASGLTLAACAAALSGLRADERRGRVLMWRGATIINDVYNSNPRALDAMVDALLAMPAERHIVIAGEMLELGTDSRQLHEACGARMAERGVTRIVGVGGEARSLAEAAERGGAAALFVETPVEAGMWMRRELRAGDAVLLKASRSVRLEGALEELSADQGEPLQATETHLKTSPLGSHRAE